MEAGGLLCEEFSELRKNEERGRTGKGGGSRKLSLSREGRYVCELGEGSERKGVADVGLRREEQARGLRGRGNSGWGQTRL